MSAAVLAVAGVSHDFGAQPVLEDVDLRLDAGELLVVLGPNGAGKTTLVRVVSGILRPRAGAVLLRGRPLGELRRREIARELAVVPQELSVPFPYSVRELVAMGRAPHIGRLGRERAQDTDAIESALAEQGLRDLAGRAFPTLSGGEKQRVVLARALAQRADALILDEATAHMDLGHRVHTFEWLRRWVAEAAVRRAALVVTHDLILAQHFADRVVLLDHGRVVATGAVTDVLTPEIIARVYEVDVSLSRDEAGRQVIVAARSRIRYTARPHEPDR